MLKARKLKGFTLVEIMVGVAIVGLLATIAVPNFLKSAEKMRTNICIKNMKLVDDTISQWAFENSKGSGETVITAELASYIKGGELPTCPLGDTAYIINNVAGTPQVACPYYDAATHPAEIK